MHASVGVRAVGEDGESRRCLHICFSLEAASSPLTQAIDHDMHATILFEDCAHYHNMT
jgi:hypothetical protein